MTARVGGPRMPSWPRSAATHPWRLLAACWGGDREACRHLWRALGLRWSSGAEPFSQPLPAGGYAESAALTEDQWGAWRACRDLGALPDGLRWRVTPNPGVPGLAKCIGLLAPAAGKGG